MSRLAVQTHTLRNVSADIETKLDRIAAAGYDGAQFTPSLGDTPPDRLAELLAARDLGIAGCHVGRSQVSDEYETTAETYQTLGCTDLVVSSYGRDGFTDEATARAAGAELNEFGATCEGDGFGLHYHNHSYEFTAVDGGTAFDAFAAASEDHLGLEIDTGLAYRADVDPVGLIDQYADRVELIHLTDTIPGSDDHAHMDLGEGEVDVPSCITAAVDAGVEWIIYENGRTDEPFASIEAAASFIETHR